MVLYVESLSPIMKNIEEVKKNYETLPVDAVIDGNTIVPGKNGSKVNSRESYLKMNEFGTFNDTFFVYDSIKPKISLYDNLDKIIIKGFDEKSVSLIFINDNELLNSLKISYSVVLKDKLNKKDNINYINGGITESDFKYVNKQISKNKLNYYICLAGHSNLDLCKKNKYMIVSPSLEINRSNLSFTKSKIEGGQIILLSNNLSLDELKIIINEIRYKGLEITDLSKLISE